MGFSRQNTGAGCLVGCIRRVSQGRPNQSTRKEISAGCSLEGLMLKLKLQYFGHLMGRADSFEKTLMLGKIEGRRRRGRQRMRWFDGHESEWTPGVGDGQGGLACCDSWDRKELDTTEQLNWTEVGYNFSSKEQVFFNFMAEVPFSVILEPPKINYLIFSIVSLSICHEVMGLDAMVLVFWMLSFKPAFSLSFTFIKRLLHSSLFSAISVVLFAYLRLLIFFLAVLIPACDSSSPAFCKMYSA